MSGLRINTGVHEPLIGDEEAGFAPRDSSRQAVRPGRHIYFTYKVLPQLPSCFSNMTSVL
jgi:hypothetical protein